jgi:hypothetical protein
MDMIRKISRVVVGLSVIVFSGWLFVHDKAAQPGPLSPPHRDLGDCTYCHVPWKGVSEKQCLACHDFSDVASLPRPRLIRFHEAKKNCLYCHQEHGIFESGISQMDHTVLNEALLCTVCHFDVHRGRFGEDCRACHAISAWKIAGYHHPSVERKDCARCHKPPAFHEDKRYWQIILESTGVQEAALEDCWRCHTTNQWPHLRKNSR